MTFTTWQPPVTGLYVQQSAVQGTAAEVSCYILAAAGCAVQHQHDKKTEAYARPIHLEPRDWRVEECRA
jgi:hypothetical protein